ncbi:MAG: hypothetical protein WAL37_00475 [Xanthobacteraceae bacterium]
MGMAPALGAGRSHYREHSLNLKRYLLCGFCNHQHAIAIAGRILWQLDQPRVTEFVHQSINRLISLP